MTALVFKYFGQSINTMTLGGLAIAIGGLVDDAVVGVENVLRRLKEDRAKHHDHRLHPIELVARATMEVRSAILYATIIIVLVFCRCSRCLAWRGGCSCRSAWRSSSPRSPRWSSR